MDQSYFNLTYISDENNGGRSGRIYLSSIIYHSKLVLSLK